MGVIRGIVGVLLVVLLLTNVFAANVVVATDRTALNGEFAKNTLEKADAYGFMQTVLIRESNKELDEADVSLPEGIDVNQTIRDTVTEAYLKNQTEANIDRVYGYLHGERDELEIVIDLSRVKGNVANVTEERIRNMTVSEMIDLVTENQELEPIEINNIELDPAVVGDMAESREDYQQAKRSLREQVREQVEQNAPEQATDEEINQTTEQLLDQYRPQIKNQTRTTLESIVPDEYGPATTSLTNLALVGIDGLTTDMSYDTFKQELSAAKADLAENASTVVRSQLEERDDQIAVHEELTQSQRDQLEQAKRAVGIVDLLVIGLPVLALVLIGLLFLVTRSLVWTAIGAGTSLTIVGGVSFLGASQVPELLKSNAPTDDLPQEGVEVAFGIINQVAGAFGAQSLAILALGAICLAAGIALHFLDREEGEGGDVNQGPATAGD